MSPLFYAVGASERLYKPLPLQRYNKKSTYARKKSKNSQLKLRARNKEHYAPHGLRPHLSKSGRAKVGKTTRLLGD